MSTLSDLQAQAHSLEGVIDSAISLIKSIPARIAAAVAAAGTDPAALPALTAELKASTDALTAAINEVPSQTGGFSVITGNISPNGDGASVTLSGDASQSVTANASGNFTFDKVPNGSYVVTPTKAGFSFSPVSQAVFVTDTSGDVSFNFTSAAN